MADGRVSGLAAVFEYAATPQGNVSGLAAVFEYAVPGQADVSGLAGVFEYNPKGRARFTGMSATYEYEPSPLGRMASVAVAYEYEPCASDISVVSFSPADTDTDVDRAERITVVIEDNGGPIDLSNLLITYTQSPGPVTSPQDSTPIYTGGAFAPGFQGSASKVSVEALGAVGQRVTIEAQPEFGHLPAGDITIEVTANPCGIPWLTVTDSATWSVIDNAGTFNLRADVFNIVRRAQRAGWLDLITARSTYEFETSEVFTGGRLAATVNEHLAAFIQQQLPREAFGIGMLGVVRRVRVLGKLSEHPREAYDAQATVVFDGFLDGSIANPVFPDPLVPGDQLLTSYTDDEKFEGVTTYYTLFVLAPPSTQTPDWRWVYSDLSNFASAFAYGRYGHGDLMFRNMPARWQAIDPEQN